MSYTHPKFPSGYATIRVTQEDIDNGERNDAESHPVALAMSRELDSVVDVAGRFAFVYRDGIDDITLPVDVQEFIVAFNAGDPVQPFEFQIPWRPRVPRHE